MIETDPTKKSGDMPWLDIRLSEDVIHYLWDIINQPTPPQQMNMNHSLKPHISKSRYMQDKDNWFYENVLKELAEHFHYKDYNNYYNVHVTKVTPPPVFTLKEIWVNFQKQYEFNPPHHHNKGNGFSFVVFMKIPTHWKEQHELSFQKLYTQTLDQNLISSVPTVASDFQFLLGIGGGQVQTIEIPLSSEDEGRMVFFPAWLTHQVFPFYGTEEERITLSGNIVDDKFPNLQQQIDLINTDIEYLQNQKIQIKNMIDDKKI